MLTRTGLYSLLRHSRVARFSCCISSETLRYAERVVHVENLPVGYDVSKILSAIKVGTQVEKIQPQNSQLSVYSYDHKCASRCLDANRSSALSLKISYAEGRLPSTIVASLGRYHASRILSIDHVPQKFDIQTLQEQAPDGVESFHYNESDAQLEIRFFDTSTAFKVRSVLHEHWSFKKSLFDYVHDEENCSLPDRYPTEEINSRESLQRSTDRFDDVSPTLVSASFVPKREILYLGFATELGAKQFMKMFQFEANTMGVEMELLSGDHTVYPSLITALDLGASRSLAFTLLQEQYNVLREKDCRKLSSRKGRVSAEPSVLFDTEALRGELVVTFDHIFSAMGMIHQVMNPRVLPDLRGSHINFKEAHQLKYLVVQ
ncbi:hypothetical protein F5146DRAFT_1125303 [Armillaria mellea]|nr:hypothetical protein F5146DRAFT_1125303 [Armillaria mellea]